MSNQPQTPSRRVQALMRLCSLCRPPEADRSDIVSMSEAALTLEITRALHVDIGTFPVEDVEQKVQELTAPKRGQTKAAARAAVPQASPSAEESAAPASADPAPSAAERSPRARARPQAPATAAAPAPVDAAVLEEMREISAQVAGLAETLHALLDRVGRLEGMVPTLSRINDNIVALGDPAYVSPTDQRMLRFLALLFLRPVDPNSEAAEAWYRTRHATLQADLVAKMVADMSNQNAPGSVGAAWADFLYRRGPVPPNASPPK